VIVVDTDLATVIQAERRAEAAQMRATGAIINSRLLALPSMAKSLVTIRALPLFRLASECCAWAAFAFVLRRSSNP
jgi:hypothetical protein